MKSAVNINDITGEGFIVSRCASRLWLEAPSIHHCIGSTLQGSGLPWELLYADDLELFAVSIEDLERKFEKWKPGMEQNGLQVNSGKTKVMISRRGQNPKNKSGKFPYGVCQKGVGRNSFFCHMCKCWVHSKCSDVKGKLAKATDFVCMKCCNGNPAGDNAKKVMLAGCNLEVVDRFCYLMDMFGCW